MAALLIVLVLFTLPVKFDACCSDDVDGEPHVVKAMLDWPTVQRRLAWDILLLVGGGFALSDGAKASGLDVWIGHRLTALEQLPPLAISFVACVFIGCLTEVVANNAAASVTLPILAQMAEKIRVNPIYLTMPAAAACNFVSIFPVGSPCLLMAFSAARVKPMEMVKDGLVAKVICVATFCLAMEAFGSVVFLDPIDPTTSGANSSSTTFHDGSRTDVF